MTLTLTVPPHADADRLTRLPVAVIGAGPVGLAAAAHLLEQGLPVVVYEAGDQVGTSVRAWGHTRLFSPWRYVIDDAARRLLEPTGWAEPRRSSLPTGHDLVAQYLEPSPRRPSWHGDPVRGPRRSGVPAGHGPHPLRRPRRHPFLLRLHTADGVEDVTARAVVDTSGTYTSPNPLTAAGLDHSRPRRPHRARSARRARCRPGTIRREAGPRRRCRPLGREHAHQARRPREGRTGHDAAVGDPERRHCAPRRGTPLTGSPHAGSSARMCTGSSSPGRSTSLPRSRSTTSV